MSSVTFVTKVQHDLAVSQYVDCMKIPFILGKFFLSIIPQNLEEKKNLTVYKIS